MVLCFEIVILVHRPDMEALEKRCTNSHEYV